MGIDLFWDGKEQKVFLLEFKDHWTWEDLEAVLRVTRRISRERQQLIGAIVDFREALVFPRGRLLNREGWSHFGELLRMSRKSRHNGPLVVVGMNGILRSVVDTVGRLNQGAVSNLRFAETISEARQLMRAELDQGVTGSV